ncbi:MAG TPA: hypothetical protein VEV45_14880 [Streptosporangiaceae bacterium]|nr:hypothetical protein [Streptosporangiaceae bacterium]
MIRLRHESLPPGLSALVRRRADGDLIVVVSAALSAGRQRAAVRSGLRAMQPAGRRAGSLPVPALIMLALAGTWLRAIGRLIRPHPVATMAVATTATAAAVVFAVAPHVHRPAIAGQNPGGAVQEPRSTPSPRVRSGATPSASAVAQPTPSAIPVAARSTTGATAPLPAASQASPATSAQQPASTPTATPAPTGTGGSSGICLAVLGIWICL